MKIFGIDLSNVFNRSRLPFLWGASAALIGLLTTYIVGMVSGFEARKMLEDSISRINTFCNTVILGSATILALLFTVIGFVSNHKKKFDSNFYARIKQVAFFTTWTFIAGMLLFLLLNFPISNSDDLGNQYYQVAYYISLGASSLVGGMMIFVIVLLYQTIVDLANLLGGSEEVDYLLEKDEEEKPKNEEHPTQH
ncbi:MAG: hypothetical protein ACPF9D_13210 [Owenweeksia sp.]